MDLEQIEHFRMPGDEIVRTSPDEGILICTGGRRTPARVT